jgi:hypothetical protein
MGGCGEVDKVDRTRGKEMMPNAGQVCVSPNWLSASTYSKGRNAVLRALMHLSTPATIRA